MIKFSNGHAFEYMTASGALGYDGKGWIWERPLEWVRFLQPRLFTSVTKTLSLQPIQGNLRWYNPLGCIRTISGGVVNAVGLTNPGIDWWCKKIGPSVDSRKIPLMVSIFGEPEELAKMARILDRFDIVGIEINASCPNTKTDILQNTAKIIESCRIVKENSRFPLILKISVIHDIEQIVKGVEDMVEALSINSVPWATAFPNRRSPLDKLGGGGISGKAAQPFTWNLINKILRFTSIPVIGPSIWQFDDLDSVRSAGAKAISFGSIFLRYPWRPTVYVLRDRK